MLKKRKQTVNKYIEGLSVVILLWSCIQLMSFTATFVAGAAGEGWEASWGWELVAGLLGSSRSLNAAELRSKASSTLNS